MNTTTVSEDKRATESSINQGTNNKYDAKEENVDDLRHPGMKVEPQSKDDGAEETISNGSEQTLSDTRYGDYTNDTSRHPQPIFDLDMSDPRQPQRFAPMGQKNIKIQTAIQRFTCRHAGCNKMFRNYASLRRHRLTHGPRTHICAECGKAFSENHKLNRHFRVHTGEKPFLCTFEGCGKQFSLDFNLRTHVRIHTGEKPYICPFDGCFKKFTQSGNLQVHIRSHSK